MNKSFKQGVARLIGIARGAQEDMSPHIVADLVFLCFERRYSKQIFFRMQKSEVFFPEGAKRVFFQNFSRGGPKLAKFVFSHSTKNTTFFAKIFKIQVGLAPLPPPSDAHAQHYSIL